MAISIKKLIGNSYFPAVAAFLVSFIVYLFTLCPTVYWGDSGEFIAVAYTLGVAHPTGYPTYTLLGHLFIRLPFGSVAFRVNLMSAFFASLAVMLLYFVCYKLTKVKWISFIAALVFAFSYTFWSQAVVAEVYTLHIFFLTLNLLILLHWKESQQTKWLYLFSFAYGLSLTNHMTSLLFLPGFAYFILVKEHKGLFRVRLNKDIICFKTIGLCSLFFLLGLLPYIYLPIRSSMNPGIDWGNPETLENFISHVRGKQYAPLMLGNYSYIYVLKRSLAFAAKTLISYGSVGMMLFSIFGILGLVLVYKKNKRVFVLLSAVFLLTSFYSVGYSIGDIAAYYLPNILILSIFASFGLTKCTGIFRKSNKLAIVFILFVIAIPIAVLITNYPLNNLSDYYFVEDYARNVLEPIENNSIVISLTDEGFFPLVYLNEIENRSLRLVVLTLAGAEWYMDKISKEFNIEKLTFPEEAYKFGMSEETLKEVNQRMALLRKRIIDANIDMKRIYVFSGTKPKIGNYSFEDFGMAYKITKGDKDKEKDFKLILRGLDSKHKNKEALAVLKGYSIILNRKAVALIQKEMYTQAIGTLKNAIKLDNNFLDAHYNLAFAYYKTMDYQNASIYARNVLIMDKNDKQANALMQELAKKLDENNKRENDKTS